MHTLICVRCGKEFQNENPLRMTCSEECRKARKRDQDIICKSGRGNIGRIVKCAYCGKEYEVTGTTQKFCSQKCRKANENRLTRSKQKNLPATCIVCGKAFMTNKNAKGKTCGPECLNKYKSLLTTERERQKRAAMETNAFGEYCMPCPWATPGKLGAGPEGVSWYSAQADPMTRGIWLTKNLETVRAKEVAA
jgi:predicted nucleic acid-binding Zn ribbon protein